MGNSSNVAIASPPQVHALEVLINVDGQEFLIHRAVWSETFEMVDATYRTKPEAIRPLNYSMKPSLWANNQIVISLGLQTVDPALPAFQTYELSKETTIDQLAVKLNVDPVLLKCYNACTESCNADRIRTF